MDETVSPALDRTHGTQVHADGPDSADESRSTLQDPAEGAWAAGLLTGAGCFQAASGTPSVEVWAPDAETIQRFHTAIGMGSVVGSPWCSPASALPPLCLWYCSGRAEVTRLMQLLWPWLGTRSKELFQAVLAEPTTGETSGGSQQTLVRHQLPETNQTRATGRECVRRWSEMPRANGAHCRRRRLPPRRPRRKEGL
jgi:hypothetical protein